MITPRPQDALHIAWLYRVLSALADDASLARVLYFKGGTCAAMLGWLDRFSIDLDFDYVGGPERMTETRTAMESTFRTLGMTIHDQSAATPQYFLKYPSKLGERNTLKIDVTYPPQRANCYAPQRFIDIDRVMTCQTLETMFANKLAAVTDRYAKTKAIAGRDIYDVHYFFTHGTEYDTAVFEERTGKSAERALAELHEFIAQHVTDTLLVQDLNTLLPYEQFRALRPTLKTETLLMLKHEMSRLGAQARNSSRGT